MSWLEDKLTCLWFEDELTANQRKAHQVKQFAKCWQRDVFVFHFTTGVLDGMHPYILW